MFVLLLHEYVHLPYSFQSSFCNRVMISYLIHIRQQSMCSLLLYMEYVYSFLCVTFSLCDTFFCVCHPPCVAEHHVISQFRRNNSLMVFGLHEYRPIYRFEASAVKAMRPILTRESSFQLILFSLLHCDVDHGVEVDILEDESLE